MPVLTLNFFFPRKYTKFFSTFIYCPKHTHTVLAHLLCSHAPLEDENFVSVISVIHAIRPNAIILLVHLASVIAILLSPFSRLLLVHNFWSEPTKAIWKQNKECDGPQLLLSSRSI